MTVETNSHPSTEPFAAHEPARRSGSIVLVLLVAAGIVAVAVALMTIGRAQAQPYILGVLALLADGRLVQSVRLCCRHHPIHRPRHR